MPKSVIIAAFAAAIALFATMFSPDAALAQDAKASAGDTAWILTATDESALNDICRRIV